MSRRRGNRRWCTYFKGLLLLTIIVFALRLVKRSVTELATAPFENCIYCPIKSIQSLSRHSDRAAPHNQSLPVPGPPIKGSILENMSVPLVQVITEEYLKNSSFFVLYTEQVTQVPREHHISGSAVCYHKGGELLFLIMSVAKSTELRMKIRQTWASVIYDKAWQQRTPFRLAFFFGDVDLGSTEKQQLSNESVTYGDIVSAQFVDSYANLSLKMAAGLTWSVQLCPDVKAVVKVDMDTFINVPLLHELVTYTCRQYQAFVLGFKHGYSKPLVVREGRWSVAEDLYPETFFPRYVYGHSYVVSRSAVNEMVKSFPYFKIIPNEDAFITGIMPVVLNVTRLQSDAFASTIRTPSICEMVYNKLVSAVCRADNMTSVWQAMKTRNCSTHPMV